VLNSVKCLNGSRYHCNGKRKAKEAVAPKLLV
jgi:hypothetical protein